MSTMQEVELFWLQRICNLFIETWWGKPSWLTLIGRLWAEWGEKNEQLLSLWASKYLADNNNHRLG